MDEKQIVNSIIIKDAEGNEKIYYKLSEFNIEGKKENFLLYTDYSKTNDKLNIYYGIFENNEIEPVKDEEEKKIIIDYINRIGYDMQNGINY